MKKRNNNGIFYVAISLLAILAVGSAAVAYSVSNNVNVEGNYNYYESEGQPVQEVELIGNTIGTDIYQPVTFWDITSVRQPDATFKIDLDFTNTTGTGNVAVKDTQAIIGSIKNTGGRKLCNMASIDVKTATGLYNMDLQLGIGTTATSSATEIAATTITTSTANILNKEDDEGSNTDEVYAIADESWITVTRTTQSVNATSSASFTTAGGMAATGTAHVNCWND